MEPKDPRRSNLREQQVENEYVQIQEDITYALMQDKGLMRNKECVSESIEILRNERTSQEEIMCANVQWKPSTIFMNYLPLEEGSLPASVRSLHVYNPQKFIKLHRGSNHPNKLGFTLSQHRN